MSRLTKPQAGLSLYPLNTTNTTLKVSCNTTTLTISYISSSLQTFSTTYVDKSVEDLCLAINSSGYPIKAIPLISNTVLKAGDLISIPSSKSIPFDFTSDDRLVNNGVVLRTRLLSIRHKSQSQIRVAQPYVGAATLPWYPRIQIGSFSHKANGKVYFFSIPEYNDQSWSIAYGKPFRDVYGEVPIQHSTTSVKLRRTPIFDRVEIFKGDSPIPFTSILDIDVHNGIVFFNEDVDASELLFNYTYKEEYFEYKDININCHFNQNPLLIGKVVLIYCIPESGTDILPSKKTVHHVVASSIPEAISSIRLPDEQMPIAIIGAYCVQQTFGSDKVQILDTRSYGGGLVSVNGPISPEHPESIIESSTSDVPIEKVYNESNSFWDIGRWDGEIYPGAAAVLINLPEDIKEILPLKDIKTKATKHLAAGVYPLFEFSERDLPDVTGWSTQISCYTGTNDPSGAYIIPITYSLPGNLTDEEWEEEYIRQINILEKENTNILSPTVESGYYIPYIKSSPIAGISWKERTRIDNPNSNNNTVSYSEWKEVKLFDTSEVSGDQLIKRNLVFGTDKAGYEYKDIVINSPVQKTKAAQLKNNIISILEEITEALDTKTSIQNDPIRYKFTDILSTGDSRVYEDNYLGLHEAYKYLSVLSDTDLVSIYGTKLYNVMFSYFSGLDFTSVFKTYNTESGNYTALASGTELELYYHAEIFSNLLEGIKHSIGTNNAVYIYLNTFLNLLLTKYPNTKQYSINSNNIYNYADYRHIYNGDGTFTGIDIVLPEVLGYGYADTNSVFEDHKYLKNNIGLTASAAAQDSITGSILTHTGLFKAYHKLIGSDFTLPSEVSTTGVVVYGAGPEDWKSDKFFVSINDTEAFVYGYEEPIKIYKTAIGDSGALLNTSWLTVGTDSSISVSVTYTGDILDYSIEPVDSVSNPSITDGALQFGLNPNKRIRLTVNNQSGDVLQIFTNPIENIPSDAVMYTTGYVLPTSGILYFPTGFTSIGLQYSVPSGARIIIPGGAVVEGSFDLTYAQGAAIEGNGVLAGTYTTSEYIRTLSGNSEKYAYCPIYANTDIGGYFYDNTLNGITIVASPFFNINAGVWKVENVQVISPWHYNLDGLTASYKNITDPRIIIKDCYTFCGDDAVKIQPSTSTCKSLVYNSFFTSLAAHSINLGYFGASGDNSMTTVLDCDFLHLGTSQYDTRQSVVSVLVDGDESESGNYRRNVLFKNITITGHNKVKLMYLANEVYPYDDSLTGSAKGQIYDFVFDNVEVKYAPVYRSLISGTDAINTPHDITFKNLQVTGMYITTGNYTGIFNINAHPYDIVFSYQADETFNNLGLDHKLYNALTDTITDSGSNIVNTWFNQHDRLGEYAGNIIFDLINCYEYLYKCHDQKITNNIYMAEGIDASSLNDYFKAIVSVLHLAKDKLSVIIDKAGYMNKDTVLLVYGYGWMSVNYDSHYKAYVGPEIYVPVDEYKIIYEKGIQAIVKSMVTEDGRIVESDYVDYTACNNYNVPVNILHALIPGMYLTNSGMYKGFATSILNTITGNYMVSGLLYNDPLKNNNTPGSEVDFSFALSKLYEVL